MIFSTSSQVNTFLIFIFCGIIFEIFQSFISAIFLLNRQKNLIKSLFLCVFYVFFSVFFIILINFFNFGNFSITLTVATLIGKIVTNFCCKKSFVILENLWYTTLRKHTKEKKIKNAQSNQN